MTSLSNHQKTFNWKKKYLNTNYKSVKFVATIKNRGTKKAHKQKWKKKKTDKMLVRKNPYCCDWKVLLILLGLVLLSVENIDSLKLKKKNVFLN